MNRHFRRVLDVLKTRKEIKALGLSRKEVKGIAAKVADKLDLKDDATEEEVTEAIDDAVDSIVPYLEVVQTVADRRLQQYKDAHPANDEDDDDEDDDTMPGGEGRRSPSKKTGKKGNRQDEDDSELAKAIAKALAPFGESLNAIKGQMEELQKGKTADSRKARLEALVKDTGKFGERTIKAFSRMSFKNEDEFEDYLDEVEADLDAENQERLNKGLEILGKPVGGNVPGSIVKETGEEESVMSDEEVKELANG
ncbi:MAG: hypothetical protein IJ064_05520 [Bacteroidaceae bacterium]|nr:hypothetical protein [Bacteroidaceae bacterium]